MQTTRTLALLLTCLALSVSHRASAAVAFTDDFESGNLNNWTVTGTPPSPLTIASGTNRVPVGGNFSALLSNSTNRMHRNIIADNGASEITGHFIYTFYMWDDGFGTGGTGATRVWNELRGYSGGTGLPNGGATANGTLSQLFAIGKATSVTALPGETINTNRYQGRVILGVNGWFDLTNGPARSIGWHKFAIERLTDNTLNFYVDGILGRIITGATLESIDTLVIGGGLGNQAGNSWMDGFTLSTGNPTITSSPQSVTTNAGATVTFSVSEVGGATYQWTHASTNLPGATGPSLTIASAQADHAGDYTVIVSNGNGSTESGIATLTVNAQAPIVTGPTNVAGCVGSDATFSVVAIGTEPITYQWYYNVITALTDKTNSSLTISNVQLVDAGAYSVVVSNSEGSTTNSATLTVAVPPTASVNSTSICASQSATLVSTTDAVNPSYLWTPGGATTANITVSPTVTTVYTVTVTDGITGCSVNATGTVTVAPGTTLSGLVGSTNCPGTPVNFSVTASGTGPFTYSWYRNNVLIQGPDGNNTYSIGAVTSGDGGSYRVEVTGGCNSASNTVSLLVLGLPTITAQPQSQTTPMGNGAAFSVTATTPSTTLAPLSYQWETNGVDVTGATGTSLAISNLALSMNGTAVRVRVSNCAGVSTSAVATLTVTVVSGISFDFDTPGQFTNAPYYLTYNNWINSSFLSGGFANVATFESTINGTGPYPGSGSMDLHVNNNIDNTSILLPVSFDFSITGKTLYASTMFKVKTPSQTTSRRATQFGFVSATNVGIADVTPQGFMSVILQSPAATTPTFEFRTQRRNTGGGLQESIFTATPLTVSNWYRLNVAFVNTKDLAANNFRIEASVQDMGPLGTTPGATNMNFTITTNNADIVNLKNVYLALRGFEDGGVESRDNTYAWTTPGNIFFVQDPQNQTASQGTRAVFRAHVDGEGPYTYQWQRDDGIGGFTNIPGARSWNYITSPTLTSDNASQYRVEVTGPANTITSAAATLTVSSSTLAVVSAGSVDGSTVGVQFNQPVDPVTAENVANYTIDGVNPKHARVYRTSLGATGPDGIYVVLTPVSAVSGSFTVVATGIQDLSGGTIGGANSAVGSVANLTGFDVNPYVTGPPGENYSFGPGQFIVTGAGSDIFSGLDGFRYVYTTMTGDFDLMYKVPYMDTTRFTAKAGIDARFSLEPSSPGALVAFDPGPMGEAASNVRQFTEGTAKHTWGAGGSSWGSNIRLFHPNVWLRFRRSGNAFLRYSSSNGVNWAFDGQIILTNTVPDTLYVGLAVCSARNLFPMSAQFENFGAFPGYAGSAITQVSSPASFTVNAGSLANATNVVTLSGGGAPAAGELSYVWQRSDGMGGFTNLPNSGLTNNIITLGPLWSTDNGAVFRCVVRAPGATEVISSTFTATVNDSAAPTVVSANSSVYSSYPVSEVLINFSELVSEATATNVANYLVTNAAGVQLTVLSATMLNGDPRNILLIVDGQLGFGTAFVRISGVQDIVGNTIATVVRNFRSFLPGTAPVVAEYYQDIGTTANIGALTNHAMFTAGQPSWISYSNIMGINAGIAANFSSSLFPGLNFAFGTLGQDNYGVKAYTYFIPPTNGPYKFWIRGDDHVQLFMNTNAVGSTNPAGKQLIAELTANSQTYSVGTVPANSKTNITLVAGQPYYMEVLMKETGGGDGVSVTFTGPNVNTAPAQATVIPAANLAYPDAVAPSTPVVTEIYTGYTPPLANNGNVASLTLATNFPVGVPPFNNEWAANFKYIAGLPDHYSHQKYFGLQPQLGNTRVDNYLGRMISYFVAPSNGLYKFYMRSDDAAQLYMNTNAVNSTDAAGKRLIGRLDAFTSAYTLVGQNISLVAGQRCLIEVLWREGTGGDGVALAVRSQGDTGIPPVGPPPEVIPASMLEYPLAYGRAGAVRFDAIFTTPVLEGQPVLMFPAGVRGAMMSGAGANLNAGPGYGFIWLRNGTVVMENSFTNLTPPITLADNGAVYTLIVTNGFSRAERSITLSVVADTTPPAIQSIIGWRGGDGFTIRFNEPMDFASTEYLGNYMANNGLALLGAELDPVTRRVLSVRTSPQIGGTNYNIMVMGVRDASAAANALSTNVSFSTWGYGGNGILVEIFTNLNGSTIGDLTGAAKFAGNLPDVVYYTNVFGVGPFGADSGLQFYGARVTALFVPTNTGYYRFYSRQDDAGMLFLNINATNSEDPNGKTMILHSQGANISLQDPRSISPPVFLNQGQRYYMEALFKEGTGGDYMLVTFRNTDANGTSVTGNPTDTVGELIGLANFGAVPGNPDLVAIASTPPSELFVTESDPVALSVVASVPTYILPYISYRWQRFDGVGYTNIPGATLPTYNFFASCTDDNWTYRVVLSAPGRDFTFSTLMHVATDFEPPYVVSASSFDGTTIGLRFNEPVALGNAQEPGNYDIDGNSPASAVVRSQDPRTVLLTLAVPVSGDFTVNVFDQFDLACNANINSSSISGSVQNLTGMDIGGPLGPGSSFTSTNGEIEIVAGGNDIWGAIDKGHMVLGQRSGDFDIWARLHSLSRAPLDNDGITKAGIMVRESLDPGARKVTYLAEPPASVGGRDIYEASQRSITNAVTAALQGGTGNTNGLPAGIPNTWIRIKRTKDFFRSFRSSNGVDWLETSSHTVPFSNSVYIGLAATAHIPETGANPTGTTFAVFKDVHVPVTPTITSQPTPADQTLPLHGSTSYSVTANNPANGGTLRYQWYRNGSPIAGANSATLNLPDLTSFDTGTYLVKVGNDGGETDSQSVNLTVNNGMIVPGADSLNVTQAVVAIPAASLTGNDSDPELQTLSIAGVSGLVPGSFSADFDSGVPAGSTPYGSTAIDATGGVGGSGSLRITAAGGNLSGSYVIDDLNSGRSVTAWSARFKVRIGDGGFVEPADGLSFNFAPDLPNAPTGTRAAEDGLGSGFSFCIDNYRYLPFVGVGSPAGSGPSTTANTSGMKLNFNNVVIAGVQIGAAWNSGRWIDIAITVTANGEATVFVDNTNVFGTVTIPGYVPKPGRFGIFARTGGQFASHAVDDLSIRTVTTLETAGFGTVSYAGGNVTYAPPTNSCGVDTFYYLVTDSLGDTKVGQVNVALYETDPQPPTIITCATNQTIVSHVSSQVALPDLTGQIVATDTCGLLTVTQSPLAGTLLNEGTNIVTLTVTDVTGLSNTCQAVIVIQVNRPSFIPGTAVFSGGTFSAQFQTVNGVNYRVEYTDSLNPVITWNLLTTIVGDGNIATITDPGPLPSMRYYRIVPMP